jgi:hypothetical protein
MALGTMRFSTAFLAFLGIALAFVCLRFVSFGTRARYDAVLTLRVTGDVASGLAALKPVLKRHATRVDLTGDRRSTAEGTDLSYRLLLRDTVRSAELQSELAGTDRFQNVSVYLHDDEAEIWRGGPQTRFDTNCTNHHEFVRIRAIRVFPKS